jgi:hypothetical protein
VQQAPPAGGTLVVADLLNGVTNEHGSNRYIGHLGRLLLGYVV